MLDDSGFYITLTLWDDDAQDEDKISKMMEKPVLIRNGLCKWFDGYGGEWQIHKPLIACQVQRKSFCIDRMTELQIWFKKEQFE